MATGHFCKSTDGGSAIPVYDLRPGNPPPLHSGSGGGFSTFSAFPPHTEIPAGPFAAVVFPLGTIELLKETAHWAASSGVSVLPVGIGPASVQIGPFTIPGRTGCCYCAYQRIAGAAIGLQHNPSDTYPPGLPAADMAATLAAEEIFSLSTGDQPDSFLFSQVLYIDIRSDRRSYHRVIPPSYCPVCGGAAALSKKQLKHLFSSETGFNDPFAGWIDQLTGVIPSLFFDTINEDEQQLPVVVTAMPPHIMNSDQTFKQLSSGWGKGLTASDALLSAIGEAVERYSASIPMCDKIVNKRPDELEGDRFAPDMFALYTESQYAGSEFPFVRYDSNVAHPWTAGKKLGTGETIWVPAVMTYLSLEINRENMLCQGTSNGCAAAFSAGDAALRAVFELVERDALITAWLTAAGGTRLSVDTTIDSGLQSIITGIESRGGTVELYVLSTAVCGTAILALSLGDGNSLPGIAIGLGCDLSPVKALRSALLELGQTVPYLSNLYRSGKLAVPATPGDVHAMIDHAAYYYPQERSIAFDWLRKKDDVVSLSTLRRQWNGRRSLRRCVELLDAQNIRVAIVDITSADTKLSPFTVVRAISPDLQPISFGFGLERLPTARIAKRIFAPHRERIAPIW